MDFEAQDSIKLLVLMISGAVFAGAGLYLLLKPKPTGSTAKIELFGLKFESSSAGVLVFLIGAVFLVIPLFVPEKVTTGNSQPSIVGETEGSPPASTGQAAVVLPTSAGASELEPNERVQQANQLTLGATVSGKTHRGDVDWYVIPTDVGLGKQLIVTLRHVSGGEVYGELFDADEVRRAQMSTTTGASVGRVEILGPVAFVKITTGVLQRSGEYELATRIDDS